MGLDVYLKRYEEPVETVLARVKQYEDSPLHESEEEDADKRLEALAAELNLDKYGDPKSEYIEINSAQFPEHMFKIGYFRSSYNAGGINSILRGYGLPDLYQIFSQEGESYRVTPDWTAAAAKARETAEAYKAQLALMDGCRVEEFDYNPFIQPEIKSKAEAAAAFKAELERKRADTGGVGFSAYENGKGTFYFGESISRLRAVILGTKSALLGEGLVPCTYLVFEGEEGKSVEDDYYYQALLIVAETCDWVLAQPDQDRLVMHWSG